MKKSTIVFLSIISLFILFSCSKMKESKLDGTWTRLRMDTIELPIIEEWSFSGGTLTVHKTYETPDTTVTYDVASYKVKKGLTRTRLEISGFHYDEYYTYNQKWRITELDNEIFGIASEEDKGVRYLEFYRD